MSEIDYSKTLFLPRTDFPMRAGLPQREPELLARWRELDIYGRLLELVTNRRNAGKDCQRGDPDE